MRFGTAIERLVDNYEYAKSKIWIRDEVAWALYHTWKEADEHRSEQTELNYSEKPNSCAGEPHTCYTCEYEQRDCTDKPCVYCYGGSKYKPKDEPQTERSSE